MFKQLNLHNVLDERNEPRYNESFDVLFDIHVYVKTMIKWRL